MTYDQLKAALYAEHLPPAAYAALFGVAFLLGAIHALGPGHGKSLVAAYLVSTKVRVRDVVALTFSLTFSHVAVVLVVGFFTLWLTDLYWPEAASRWLGLAAGMGILGVGFWLLHQRLGLLRQRGVRMESGHEAATGHVANEGHHVHYDAPTVVAAGGVQNAGSSLGASLSLGFSGGLIPCPKAIVILLLAISLHRVALGIWLIVAFSFGVATTLLALSFLVIRFRDLVLPALGRQAALLLPVAGAAVVILLGCFVLYRSALAFG